VLRGWAVLCCVCLLVEDVRADDVHVDSQTTLQAYDVQSPATSVVWTRRRLTQTLGLQYVKPLDDRRDGPAPALGAHVQLRLDQDFGNTCTLDAELCFAVVNPSRRGSYTPLVSDGVLDMPLAYVEARELPHGLEARAGRQLHHDVIGFARVDGASMRVAPSDLFAAQALGGLLVRSESIAGSDAFVPDGVPRLSLSDLEQRRAPYIEAPLTTWLGGATIELGHARIVRGSTSLRVLAADGVSLERRVGAGLVSQPIEALRLSTHGVYDTLDLGVIDAELGADVWTEPLRAHASIERHVPRFEPTSVWAYFDVAPIWMATLGAGRSMTRGWDVDVALRGRRTELSDGGEHDLGVEITSGLRDERHTLTLSGFGWAADAGPLWGGSLAASRRMTLALTLEAEVSVMRIDNPLRSAIQGVSVYELIAARVAITDESDARIAISHAASEPVGHRFAMLAFLHVGAWR
jgi:hypothetical protein